MLKMMMAVVLSIFFAMPVEAALVEIRFAGKIDGMMDRSGVIDDSVRVGDRMWISLIHDIDAPSPIISDFPREKRREGAGVNSPLISYSAGSGSWQIGETAVSSRVWTYDRASCCLDGYGGEATGSRGRAAANLTSTDDILPFDFTTEISRAVPITSEGFFRFDGFSSYLTFDIDSFSVTRLAVVPEPGAWVMMLVGFGLIGATTRYRRRATTITYT